MAKNLHKLGAWAFKHPVRIVAIWLLLLGLLGFMAVTFMKPTSSSLSIPGTEAQKAIGRVGEIFPNSGGATGRIVFQSKNGKTIADMKPEILALTDKVAKINGVAQVASPFVDASFVSKSGTIAYAQVQMKDEIGSIPKSTLQDVASTVNSARSNTLQIETGGALINNAPGEIIGVGELGGVVLALIVLVITLGSLIAAGMPIVTALIGVGVSTAGLFSLSRVITINSTTPVLAIMLGLAVGIDYALFIINKYRYYAQSGLTFEAAAARSVGTAGNAVVFAAMTVVIALAALSVVRIPFMTTMGLVGAASIVVAALVAITLVPALLGLFGKRVFSRKQRTAVEKVQLHPSKHAADVKHSSIWYRWGEVIVKRPLVILIAAVLAIIVLAVPAKSLQLGLPTDQYSAVGSTQRTAYELLSKGFGAGFNGPLTVVVEGLPQVSDADRQTVRQAAMATYNKQVAAATTAQQAAFAQAMAAATTPEQQLVVQQQIVTAQAAGAAQQAVALQTIEANVTQYAKYVQLKEVADNIAKLGNVAAVLPAKVTDDGTKGIVQVIPKSAPADVATKDLIRTLRSSATQENVTNRSGATLAVTGSTALQEDINEKLAAALPVYLAVVVGLSLVLLIIAFRSILVPLKATLGFLLSVAAMFGSLVAVFQWGWFGVAHQQGPIVSFIPIIAIGILFGLAMDYEFFLVSGMHEAYNHTKDAAKSVIRGFGMGSKVVTAAAIIMVSVFAGFVFNHDATIQALGFGLAFGILVDAFLVRMTIVPAVMALLGKKAWWLPKWLDRRLPHVSIEGEDE